MSSPSTQYTFTEASIDPATKFNIDGSNAPAWAQQATAYCGFWQGDVLAPAGQYCLGTVATGNEDNLGLILQVEHAQPMPPIAAVPEPSIAALLVVCVAFVAVRRAWEAVHSTFLDFEAYAYMLGSSA